jgi:hypothetical protein
VDEAKLAWTAWMKQRVCYDVLDWWKEDSARFPLIARAAKNRPRLSLSLIEVICGSLFKRAKHIGTTVRMARLLDESFEMLVMEHCSTARHGGAEAIRVIMFSDKF